MLPHEVESISQRAIEGIIKGYPHIELCDIIQKDYKEAPYDEIEKLVKKAIATIREETLTDIDQIIPQHIELYEKIYKQFDELSYIPGKLKALRQKEKLVGLHRDVTKVDVFNDVDITIESDSPYDLNKLSLEDQKKLELYLNLTNGGK